MILVTGASGHLGNVLVRGLVHQGRDVRVLVRRLDQPALRGLKVDVALGDVLDPESLADGCRGCTMLYHSAALISTLNVDRAVLRRVNIEGTRNLLAAARREGIGRFIYVSSVEALDLTPTTSPISSPCFDGTHALMEYGKTKAEATRLVIEASGDLHTAIGIPSGLIGPFDFGTSRTVSMVRQFLARRLPAYVDGAFDFADVRDVAEGLISIGERGEPGAAYFLTGHLISLPEIMIMLEEISGVRRPRLKAPYPAALLYAGLSAAAGKVTHRMPLFTPNSLRILQTSPLFDLTESNRVLGYRPRPMRETLEDTVAWVRGGVTQETV